MAAVAAVELREDFDRYLTDVQDDGEILIMEDGKPVACLISQKKINALLSERATRMVQEKYGSSTENVTETAAYENID